MPSYSSTLTLLTLIDVRLYDIDRLQVYCASLWGTRGYFILYIVSGQVTLYCTSLGDKVILYCTSVRGPDVTLYCTSVGASKVTIYIYIVH